MVIELIGWTHVWSVQLPIGISQPITNPIMLQVRLGELGLRVSHVFTFSFPTSYPNWTYSLLFTSNHPIRHFKNPTGHHKILTYRVVGWNTKIAFFFDWDSHGPCHLGPNSNPPGIEMDVGCAFSLRPVTKTRSLKCLDPLYGCPYERKSSLSQWAPLNTYTFMFPIALWLKSILHYY